LIIGPNRSVSFLKVGDIGGDTAIVIVPAMRAREKLLR
jgi:hypothetical protein